MRAKYGRISNANLFNYNQRILDSISYCIAVKGSAVATIQRNNNFCVSYNKNFDNPSHQHIITLSQQAVINLLNEHDIRPVLIINLLFNVHFSNSLRITRNKLQNYINQNNDYFDYQNLIHELLNWIEDFRFVIRNLKIHIQNNNQLTLNEINNLGNHIVDWYGDVIQQFYNHTILF